MNLPEIVSYEDNAIDIAVSVINRAKEKLGLRQTLKELVSTRYGYGKKPKLDLTALKIPLVVTSENLIREAIEKKWKLAVLFKYMLKYLGGTTDETSQYYYYEAIFSQPTVAYPIPQAYVSVFFRVQDEHIESEEFQPVPSMVFRVEGQHSEHDVRHVHLTPDWILATLKMKIDFYRRIEKIRLF